LEESRSIYVELGDDEHVAFVLSDLAIEATVLGDYAEAAELMEAGLVHARRSGSPWPVMPLVANQGNLALQQGEYELAIGHFEELLEITSGFGDEGRALYNLGFCFARTGRWDEAICAGKRSLTLCHEARDMEYLVWEFVLLASFAIQQRNFETGAVLIGSAEAVRDGANYILTGAEAELYRSTLAQLDDVLGEARLEPLRARGRTMTLDEAVDYALTSVDG
jgi:tetratricopeptide (TPR) repeat protein